MVRRNTETVQIELEKLSVDLHARIRFPSDPKQVGIVVSKNDVNRTGVLSQFVHHERRTEVAAADQYFGLFREIRKRRPQIM